jgi:group II intron reverse transcriptase/maturase
MQSAEVVLSAIRKCGSENEPLQRVYRQLFNRELYLLAYGRIYRNAGATTPGPDSETVDGMSLERIDKVIALIRHERYAWKPVRRVYIEKKSSTKKRPLGIPGWSDKLVQEVIRLILEAYYEPQFSNRSHGFRPNRGCGTALQEILYKWDGTKWFIEGDIKGCFDNIDHATLMSILAEKIQDNRFLRLISESLKAGYLEDWRWNPTLSGTPQGGIISPILANIYLDRLDKFVEDKLLPTYNQGENRRKNKPYKAINYQIARAGNGHNMEKLAQLQKLKQTTPCLDPYDPNFRRLRYIRYADDFLLGYAGPQSEAEKIKELLRDFLRDNLKLEMSEEKTKITHARSDAARFLGYEVHTMHDDRKRTNGRRAINGRIGLKVPYEVITEKCARYTQNGKPVHLPERLHCDVFDIIEQYQAEYRGFVEYYRRAHNLSTVGKLNWVMQVSLVKTLANKLRISQSQVYERFAQNIQSDEGPRRVLRHEVARDGKQPLIAQWGNISLKWNKRADIQEPTRFPWDERVQLIDRLLADTCELCGSQENVEVHHINHIKSLWKDGRKAPEPWKVWMASRRRKTIVVCRAHHKDIHFGRSTVVPFPKNTGEPDDQKWSSPVRRGLRLESSWKSVA